MRRPSSLNIGVCHVFALLLGCGPSDGLVEVSWQIDDGSLTRLFPQGELTNTCALPSTTPIKYDLRVRLRVVENSEACILDPTSEGCIVHEELFPCHRYRQAATSVPPSGTSDDDDPGYLMLVDLMIDPTDTPPFVPTSDCVQGPGPRIRGVKPGRLTDLEVYQFIFAAYDPEGIDIEDCVPSELPDPGTTETGGATETGGP